MSIIPGIENTAPERTETSSGSRVAEALAGALLERGEVLQDLGRSPSGSCRRAAVGAARLGRDREAVRDGDAEPRHLGEVVALAAEQLALSAEPSARS